MRRLTAGFMAVWLSGFLFLFCCQTMPAAANEVESCPMAMAVHHDIATVDPNIAHAANAAPLCIDCCAFLPAVFDKSRKVEPVQKHMTPAAVPFVAVTYNPPVVALQSPSTNADVPFIPDRGSTYLRNCVFRI